MPVHWGPRLHLLFPLGGQGRPGLRGDEVGWVPGGEKSRGKLGERDRGSGPETHVPGRRAPGKQGGCRFSREYSSGTRGEGNEGCGPWTRRSAEKGMKTWGGGVAAAVKELRMAGWEGPKMGPFWAAGDGKLGGCDQF